MTTVTRFKSPSSSSKDICAGNIAVKLPYFRLIVIVIVTILNIIKFTAVRSEEINNGNATNTTHIITTPVRNTYKFQLLPSDEPKTENENNLQGNYHHTANATKCPREPTIQVLNMYAGRNYTRRSNDEDGKVLFYTIAQDSAGKIVIIENTGHISMSCRAREPVMWSFSGALSQEVIKSMETSREALDPQNPETFCYTTKITVPFPRPPKFPTLGQYACVNPQTNMDGGDLMGKNVTSVFLFANDNLPDLFPKPNGKSLISKAFSSDTSVIVPCRGNNPNFTAVLTKKDKNESYTPLNSDLYYQVYNPKYGFTITPKASNTSHNTSLSPPPPDFKSDLYGNYKCRSVKPKYGRAPNPVELNVLVISAGDKSQTSSQLKIVFQNFKNGRCKRFVCLADSNLDGNGENISLNSNLTNLEMSAFECSSPTNCQLSLGFLTGGSDNPSNLQYLQSPDNTAENDACEHVQYNSSTDEQSSKVASLDISAKYEGGGVVICRTSDKQIYQYVQFFSSLASAVVLNSFDNVGLSSEIDGASLIHITGPNRTIYVKENVEIKCNFSSFLFTNGYKLLVKYSNGSLGTPQIISYNENFFAEQLIFKLSAVVNATSESMIGFVCLAPLWNSKQWVNLTYPVTVSEGTVPVFLDVSDSSVACYDTDENITLVCEAGGSPVPVVTWYNNGEPYEDSTRNAWTETIIASVNSSRSLLHFKNVTYNAMTIQGIYTCNATNVRGTVTFPITVQVDMFQTWMYWALPLSILFLILMITLSVYLCKFWKKSQAQKRYINQLTKYEIQQFKYGRRSVKTPGRDDSVKDISSGLPNYANISGGIEEALDLPYDEAKFEIPEQDLVFEEIPIRLGEGNFGIVLQGTLLQDSTRLPVAVKTLKQWNVNEAKILLSELKILMFVGKHENVVSLLGAVTNIAEYKIQVVIEYCAEGSLEKFLRDKRDAFLDEVKDGRIQFTQVPFENTIITNYVKTDFALRTFDLIRWAHQFARGMEYLSARKIIHGDLAARNLLLTDTRELKITDFGLSKKLKNYQKNYIPSDSSSEREQPWRSLAVECWVDNKKLSTESDVWAYGITLWEIFSLAKVPYPDFPMYTPDFIRHLLQGYRMSSPPYATKHIFKVMMDCWESAPENRPTFSMLVMTFEKFLPQNYVKSLHYFNIEQSPSPVTIIEAKNNQNYENNLHQPQPQPQPPRPKNIAHNVGYIYADDMEQLEMKHL